MGGGGINFYASQYNPMGSNLQLTLTLPLGVGIPLNTRVFCTSVPLSIWPILTWNLFGCTIIYMDTTQNAILVTLCTDTSKNVWYSKVHSLIAVADPGFPWGGGATSQSGIILQTFCRKLHENERIWIPLDPPMNSDEIFGLAIIASNGNQPTEGLFCVVFWWATELQATDRSQEPIQNVSCLLLFEMAHNLFLFFLLHQI